MPKLSVGAYWRTTRRGPEIGNGPPAEIPAARQDPRGDRRGPRRFPCCPQCRSSRWARIGERPAAGPRSEMARRRKFRRRDKTLGVIGVGHVGSLVVRNAEALGVRVLANDPPRARAKRTSPFVPLERLLAEADIITLHVPLTREGVDTTFHLFDKDRLGLSNNRRPILINTSRGAVVDNPALIK